jgi:uncharacterized protein involved in exopolysaccharide biosynthesis
MTPETESRAPTPELEPEQEIDFGRYLRRIAARWWLPVAGIVIGALIGLLTSTASSRPYEAKTTVYLGQPSRPGTDTPITNFPNRIEGLRQLADSDEVVDAVSSKIGVSPGRLRAAVSTDSVGIQRGRVEQSTLFLEIKVRGLARRKAIAAAEALAKVVVDESSSFVRIKLDTATAARARAKNQLAVANKQIDDLQRRSTEVSNDRSLASTDKLILLANLENKLQFYETRQATLESSLLTSDDNIALLKQVELARVTEPAKAARVSAPSNRTAAVIGGLIGLLLGIVAALLWDPLAARLEKRQRSE